MGTDAHLYHDDPATIPAFPDSRFDADEADALKRPLALIGTPHLANELVADGCRLSLTFWKAAAYSHFVAFYVPMMEPVNCAGHITWEGITSRYQIEKNVESLTILSPPISSQNSNHQLILENEKSADLKDTLVWQSAEQNRMKPLMEAAIVDVCSNTSTLSCGNMVIADLGCSSGPNAVALVSIALEATCNHFLQLQQSPPEVSLLLNDLPYNDFNRVVKSLVALRQINEPVVVAGVVPGSFYERLFPSGSVHLFCSSNSLHWLSKAPEDLRINQIPAYDIDENVRRERLPVVAEAYARQFRKDFTLFLKLRAKELVSDGRMVVSLAGRRSDELVSEISHVWGTAAQILGIMASEGMIDKAKFNSLYIPVYGPSLEELREIIQEEGSFTITEMRVHNPASGMDSAHLTPNRIANCMRAAFEPLINQHFGSSGEVMDGFVRTAEKLLSLQGSSQVNQTEKPIVMLVVSVTKASHVNCGAFSTSP
ncbi:Salicylate O-methyltransferase [Hordeum vulgare]|nr:Salicylate O-methyltransferase [Hordeum vulgare]